MGEPGDERVYRIGVDVGGTFTDVFLIGDDGTLIAHKLPSTPHDPSIATLEGMRAACDEASLTLQAVAMIFHGSTVATNTVLQRSGAKVGLITTEGFRDVLHIARHKKPLNFSLYQQLPWQKQPLVRRQLRLTVTERVEPPDGRITKALDEDQVRAAAKYFQNENVEAIAVCFLHSYLNPTHEARVAELLNENDGSAKFPFLSLRHVVCPEYREYEAFNTVAMNAYVGPVTGAYVARLQERLAEEATDKRVLFMTSSGGVETPDAVARRPVNMLLSGPVAGVIAGLATGRSAGFQDLITLDVGGTSADIGIVLDGRLRHKHWLDNEIAGFALRLSMIDVSTIGAGGGSIARIDAGGMLNVGPNSAGSDPGPACYGRGGDEPTITDAQVVLGRLRTDTFLGGRMQISRELAERAILEKVATPLGLDLESAAAGVLRVGTHHMVAAIELNSVRRGYDPRRFALVAFGGGGPLFATDIARELAIPYIIVPPFPGIASAIGLLTSDVVHTYAVSIVGDIAKLPLESLRKRLSDLEKQAAEQLRADGFDASDMIVERYAECRYAGQGYEIQVTAPSGTIDGKWVSAVAEAFHQAHQREYARSSGESVVELVNVGVHGVGRLPGITLPSLPDAVDPLEPASERDVWFEGIGMVPTAVFPRAGIRSGHEITGPAIVEQEDSTVLVPPSLLARADPSGNIVISLET